MAEPVKERILTHVCKVFGNATRYKILLMLGREPHTFGTLLKELAVNPKVLNDHLNLLTSSRLVTKSYPYNVYVLTPAGRVVKEGLDTLDVCLSKIAGRIGVEKEA